MNINSQLPSGQTILTASIQGKNYFLVENLLQRPEVDPNAENIYMETPLMMAMRNKDEQIMELLLQRHDLDINKPGRFDITPLTLACQSGQMSWIQTLLHRGVVLNNKQNGPESPVYAGALVNALQHEDIALLLIQAGVSVNYGWPLLKAINAGSDKITAAILDSKNFDLDHYQEKWACVIEAAVRYHNCAIVKRLLEVGLLLKNNNKYSVKKKPIHKSPCILGWAIHYGCMSCFQLLLRYTDNINEIDHCDNTALHYSLDTAGWYCHRRKILSSTHAQCMKYAYGNAIYMDTLVTPFRLDFTKELLMAGADIKHFWDKNIWSRQDKTAVTNCNGAVKFCLQVYHCDERVKLQSMFRYCSSCKNTYILALLYLGGYQPDEGDITILYNNFKKTKYVNGTFENTPFMTSSMNHFDLLRTAPRTLQNLCVISARRSLGPNLYKPIQEMQIPVKIKNIVLLIDIFGLLPSVDE